jgi:hypothetical protein
MARTVHSTTGTHRDPLGLLHNPGRCWEFATVEHPVGLRHGPSRSRQLHDILSIHNTEQRTSKTSSPKLDKTGLLLLQSIKVFIESGNPDYTTWKHGTRPLWFRWNIGTVKYSECKERSPKKKKKKKKTHKFGELERQQATFPNMRSTWA